MCQSSYMSKFILLSTKAVPYWFLFLYIFGFFMHNSREFCCVYNISINHQCFFHLANAEGNGVHGNQFLKLFSCQLWKVGDWFVLLDQGISSEKHDENKGTQIFCNESFFMSPFLSHFLSHLPRKISFTSCSYPRNVFIFRISVYM